MKKIFIGLMTITSLTAIAKVEIVNLDEFQGSNIIIEYKISAESDYNKKPLYVPACTIVSKLWYKNPTGPATSKPEKSDNNAIKKHTLVVANHATVPTSSAFQPSSSKDKTELDGSVLDTNIWCYGGMYPSYYQKVERQSEIDDKQAVFPAKLNFTTVLKDGETQLTIREFTESVIVNETGIKDFNGSVIKFIQ